MTEPVVVIVGDWECGEDGSWAFKVEKNVMAQCIRLSPHMDYVSLKEAIEYQFDLFGSNLVPELSFWMPTELSVLTATQSPPVCIRNNNGLSAFRKVREGRPWLSLFVSFSSQPSNSPVAPFSPAGVIGSSGGSTTPTGMYGDVGGSSSSWDYGMVRLRDNPPSSGEAVGENVPEDIGEATNPAQCPLEEETGHVADEEALGTAEQREAAAEEYRRKGKGKQCDGSSSNKDKGLAPRVIFVSDTEEDIDTQFWNEMVRGQEEETGGFLPNETPGLKKIDVQNYDPSDQVVPDMNVAFQGGSSNALVPEAGDSSVGAECTRWLDRMANAMLGKSSGDGNEAGGTSEQLLVDVGMADTPEPSDFDEDTVRSTLASLYKEIRDSEVLPTRDAAPLFDDTYVLTGQEVGVGYEEANDAIFVGRQFRNKAEFLLILRLHAIKRKFTFRGGKSDKERVIARCVDPQCNWRVYAHIISPNSPNLEIRTASLIHTCTVETRAQYGKQANAKVVAHVLKQRYTNGKMGPRPVDIPDIMLQELRVSITYMKAWYAKEQAIEEARGSSEQSYKLLRSYMYLLKKANPGTIYTIKTLVGNTGGTRFKYLFFALGASISGLPYLRQVICIDGTAIKAKFKGIMLTATMQDANFRVFPLGFGVVDGENDAAWTWFLNELSRIIPDSPNLMFISDRHPSIYNAIAAVYPLANHSACSVHLSRNVRYRFKGKGLSYLVSKAATAFGVGEFRHWFTEIERRSPDCANYLREIGLSHWTQAYCYGMKYNITSTNIAESLNATIAKALQYPIVSMVETIRMNLMQWFCWRREEARMQSSALTDSVEKELMNQLQESGGHSVVRSSETIFQVNTLGGTGFTVDMGRRSCSCRYFDKVALPCSHALAAARFVGLAVNPMAAPVYTTEFLQNTYACVVMPVPNVEDEDVPEEGNDDAVTHPQTRRGLGRPRKRRISSNGELGRKRTRTGHNRCSRCFEKGHNKTTCKEPLP